MKECTINKINTTVGIKYLAVTLSKSKEFKTQKGAERWVRKNGYSIKQ